jgi:hypothetical protein
MTTIHRTVEIPADRRLNLSLDLPDELLPGQAELYLEFLQPKTETTKATFADFAGCLKDDTAFAGDALEIQRKMRDEW